MFTLIAAVIFSTAAILALGTIGTMFLAYRDKMIAALTFEPMPATIQMYELRISRPRVFRQGVTQSAPRASAQSRGLLAA